MSHSAFEHGCGRYRIIVRGRLTARFDAAFEGMTIEPGDEASAVVGVVGDQAQLLGLIDRAVGLGLELVSFAPDASYPDVVTRVI